MTGESHAGDAPGSFGQALPRKIGMIAFVLIAAVVTLYWLGRATWVERPGLRDVQQHYLPIPSGQGFVLDYEDGSYRFASSTCTADEVLGHGSDIRCPARSGVATLWTLDTTDSPHLLTMSGLTIEVPRGAQGRLATIGQGRDNDVIWSIAGVGARHAEILPASACDEAAAVCVVNRGLHDSLIVDRSERRDRLREGPGPLIRESLAQGAMASVSDGDHLWLGLVPLRVTAVTDGEGTRVELRIPGLDDPGGDWVSLAGQRSWMNLGLPRWDLARVDEEGQPIGRTNFEFGSREWMFYTGFPFWMGTNIADYRIEWELEERLQEYVDHELLCLRHDDDGYRLAWNLAPGVGCAGRPTVAAPSQLLRVAGEHAFDRETNDKLSRESELLSILPRMVPNPDDLGFVYDWRVGDGCSDEPDAPPCILPQRLIGIRPLSTRNAPRFARAVSPGSEPTCRDLVDTRPSIDLAAGSTSPLLEVVDGELRGVTRRLMLVGNGRICVGKTGRSARRARSTELLGALSVGRRGVLSELPPDASPDGALCVQIDGDLQIQRTGPGAVRVKEPSGEVRALGTDGGTLPLHHGSLLVLEGPGDLTLRVAWPDAPDRAAASHVDEDSGVVVRVYPFGEDLAPVLGAAGLLWEGLETTLDDSVWQRAQDEQVAACQQGRLPERGVGLTLRGDLQRLLYEELAAEVGAVDRTGERVTAHAVLLDAEAASVLAAVNFPSFDPSDEEAILEERRQLSERDGSWRAPERYTNQAFLRRLQLGSVYKLATTYALARRGLLTEREAQRAKPLYCKRLALVELGSGSEPRPTVDPTDLKEDAKAQCSAFGMPTTDPAPTYFARAFEKSVNQYFATAAVALVDGSGVGLHQVNESPPWPGAQSAGFADPTARLYLQPGFEVADFARTPNHLYDTLFALGHRLHLGDFSTRPYDGVDGVRFPTTGEHAWLPGVRRNGFSYPSVEALRRFAIDPAPPRHQTVELVRSDGTTEAKVLELGDVHVVNYLRQGYGKGGLQANALSLAVMGAPVARQDRSAISPRLVEGFDDGIIVEENLVSPTDAKTIRDAMRSVLATGTGKDYFKTLPEHLRERLGGKTGTFVSWEQRTVNPRTRPAYESVRAYACGHVDAPFDKAAFESLSRATKPGSSIHRGFEAVLAGSPPAPGFGAAALDCDDINPGAAGASRWIGGPGRIDGSLWLDDVHRAFGRTGHDMAEIPGGSMLVVAFEGLTPEPDLDCGATGNGRGWVLAVVADGSESVAKRAAARMVQRLADYLAIQCEESAP